MNDAVTHRELLGALIAHGGLALVTIVTLAVRMERRIRSIEDYLKMKDNGKATDVIE